MATYPVYPATTFTQAVELTIFASNQLHDVINGDALTTVETENGDVPTLRKALVDNFYFKTPIPWVEGESSTVFNQLYYFDGTPATSGWYYAPQATLDNPIAMGSTPLNDDNWRLYQTATQSIPAQVYPWATEITQVTSSITPPYEFDTAIVTYNSAVLVAGKDYTIANNTLTFTPPLTPEPDAEIPDILFCYIGKVEEGNPDINYVTYSSLAAPTAAGLIGTVQGKTLQSFINTTEKFISIYVDELGNFNNLQDGCAEAITSKITELTGMTDSAYVFGQNSFVTVYFGEGSYKLKDMTCFSGVFFKGKPGYATQIIPHESGDYAFKTVGTLPFDLNGTRVWQRLMYFGFEDLIIGEYWEDTGKVTAGVGGIKLEFTSYGYMRNVHFRRIKASAFSASELFDFKGDNVTIMYCGSVNTDGTINHSLNLDKSGSDDATNACEFDRLHLEANYTGMRLRICRHMNFIAPKFERDDTSHLLEGCQGVVFTSANMTWNSATSPQFDVYGVSGTETSDSHGVKFVSPDMRSSNKIGWYFRSNSNAGPLELVSPTMRGISTLITGTNWKIIGGDAYDSGPQLISATSNASIDNFTAKLMKPITTGGGADDAIIITGVNCAIRNSYFSSQVGSVTDNGAFINTSSTTDTIVTGNTFAGTRQYGIRGALNQKIRDNKIDPSNSNVGSLTNQTRTNTTVVNKNSVGFGLGSVDGEVTGLTIGTNASLEWTKIYGASLVWLRVISASSTGSAIIFVDSSNSGLVVVGNTNTSLISTTSGSIGDGLVHITKPSSGNSITITNYTTGTITLVPMTINGHG